jgi:hypothetical protein
VQAELSQGLLCPESVYHGPIRGLGWKRQLEIVVETFDQIVLLLPFRVASYLFHILYGKEGFFLSLVL